jgi:hypothetical protein
VRADVRDTYLSVLQHDFQLHFRPSQQLLENHFLPVVVDWVVHFIYLFLEPLVRRFKLRNAFDFRRKCCLCVGLCMYVCIYVYVHYIFYVCVYTCMHMYLCMYACIYMYVCVYIYIYIYIYTYTCTCTASSICS